MDARADLLPPAPAAAEAARLLGAGQCGDRELPDGKGGTVPAPRAPSVDTVLAKHRADRARQG